MNDRLIELDLELELSFTLLSPVQTVIMYSSRLSKLRAVILLIIGDLFTSLLVVHAASPLPKTDKTIAYCSNGMRAYGVTLTQFSDTPGLREAQFHCKKISDGTANGANTITSDSVITGSVLVCAVTKKQTFCPLGGFIIGYQLYRNDNGIISDMRLYCSNHPFTDHAHTKGSGWTRHNSASWRKTLRCPFGQVMCGVKTHVIRDKDKKCKGDTDQLRIACCDKL